MMRTVEQRIPGICGCLGVLQIDKKSVFQAELSGSMKTFAQRTSGEVQLGPLGSGEQHVHFGSEGLGIQERSGEDLT